MQKYGNLIWKFVPTTWRYWWLDSFQAFFADTSIEQPCSYFVDRTYDIQRWDELITSCTLPNLRDACNELLIPKILCPFGCSEFYFKHGIVSLDIVIQRYLPKCLLKKYMSNKAGFVYIETARDDYIRNENDYDSWLLNDEWKIEPSIAFIDGAPHVLTCKDHTKGSKLYHIHIPRKPGPTLPSKYSDQLSHCVMRCRTVKPMKKSKYSIAYQMHEQRGSFNGIDTCNVTSYRDFSFRSKLLSDYESMYILNRPDINSLLNQLVDERAISKHTAYDKRSYAKEVYNNFNFEPYITGATYVPLECALQMKHDVIDPSTTAVIDDRVDENGNHLNDITMSFKKYWPSVLYPCQKNDEYGVMFARPPAFNTNKLNPLKMSNIWTMSTLILIAFLFLIRTHVLGLRE